MNRLIFFASAVGVAAFALRGERAAHAQEGRARPRITAARAADHTVWDSVFTDSQSVRGDSLFRTGCIKCHGEDLAGNDSVASLTGDGFLSDWDGLSVFDLYDKILSTMPSDNPNTVPSNQVVDLVAFLLSKNTFPAGTQVLPDDVAVLKTIKFIKTKP